MTKAEQLEALRQRRITVGFNRMLAPEPDFGTELVTTEKLLLAVNESDPLADCQDILAKAVQAGYTSAPVVVDDHGNIWGGYNPSKIRGKRSAR